MIKDITIRVALVLAAAIILTLLSCNSEKKALEKTQLYLFKHPEFSAGYCAEQFPDKPDSVITKTDTLTEILFLDSIVYDRDTSFVDTSECRPKTIIKKVTVTIRKDSIIYRENRAEQERLQLALLKCNENTTKLIDKNTKLEQELSKWRKTAKVRWWWIALLIGGAVGYTVLKVYGNFKKPIV